MGLTRPRAYQIFDLDYKQSTRVVTVTNITLSGGAPNQVDGVNLSLNDRILVTGQTTGSQNGLYYVTTVGTGSNGTWARSVDGNETGEIEAGMIIMVTEGTVYADTQWKLTTNDPIVIGTTALTFVQNYSTNSISSGTSNVVVNSNANVTISSAGTPNVLSVSGTSITAKGNLLPDANVTYSLGSTSQRWKDLWISNSTIYIGETTITASGNTLIVGGSNVVTQTSTGNISASNVVATGSISAVGNITGNYILGNGALLTGVITSVANINNGTSNVTVVSSGGNVTVGVGGTSNIAVFTTTGQFINGLQSVTGNIVGGNLTINNNALITGNLTVSGTTTTINTNTLNINDKDIVVANNVTGGANIDGAGLLAGNPTTASFIYRNATTSWQSNVGIAPDANATLNLGGTSNYWATAYLNAAVVATNVSGANINATTFYGSGAGLTAIPGANVTGTVANAAFATNAGTATTAGTVTTAAQPNITSVGTLSSLSVTGNVTGGNLTTVGQVTASGNITGNYFIGNGSQLTGITGGDTIGGNLIVLTRGGNVNFAVTAGYLVVNTRATGNVSFALAA